MKKTLIPLVTMALIGLAISCNPSDKSQNYVPESPKLTSDVMTPEVLWSFGRLGGVRLSPDQSQVLFSKTYYNIEENRSYRDLYLLPVEGGESLALTNSSENENNPIWRGDGNRIGFIRGGIIHEMNPDGTLLEPLEGSPESVGGFSYSPDMKHIAFLQEVKIESDVHDMHPDLPMANARVIDDLMHRHWDSWVDTYTHIFVAKYEEGIISEIKDIMLDEPWDAPLKPFGGMEQITWSPDGKKLVYTSRKKKGLEYTLSTNSDLYEYKLNSGQTRNLTGGMMGYDINPIYSPDGNGWHGKAWKEMVMNRIRTGYF